MSLNCRNIQDGYDCNAMYDCCDCGGVGCGCPGCWSCNACEICLNYREDV